MARPSSPDAGLRLRRFSLGSGLRWILLSPKGKSRALWFGCRAHAAIVPASAKASRSSPSERPFQAKAATHCAEAIRLHSVSGGIARQHLDRRRWLRRREERPRGGAEDPPALSGKLELVEFDSSPFPYRGNEPAKGKPFLDVNSNNRLGHTSVRGGVYWEDETYNDRHTLLFIPARFDIRRPAVIVVFFHGNQALLERDVSQRQEVPRQIAESGLNAVLVAPQLASDALDSSAGHFWEEGGFRRYLDEAAARLAHLYGSEAAARRFGRMPVVLVAYSGGYLPAAFSIAAGGADNRLAGLVLLDALYGELDRYADWIARHASTTFFLSAYSRSSSDSNSALQAILAKRGVTFSLGVPASLTPGSVAFVKVADSVGHDDFVSNAWTRDPLKAVLSKVPAIEPPVAVADADLPASAAPAPASGVAGCSLVGKQGRATGNRTGRRSADCARRQTQSRGSWRRAAFR